MTRHYRAGGLGVRLALPLLILIGVSGGGCGPMAEPVATSPSTTQATGKTFPPLAPPESVGAFSPISINEVASLSHAAAIGTVTDVSQARWNSKDGRKWDGDRGPGQIPAMPWLYRDVTLAVKQVIYRSDVIPVQEDGILTVRLYGDGTESGNRIDGGFPGMRENSISGPVQEGDDVLWVLKREKFVAEDSPEVIRLFVHFQGNWVIENGMAVSAEPRRTVPLDPLVDKLRAERAGGLRPDAQQDGLHNPLE